MSLTKADISGLFTAIVTPFGPDNAVDFPVLKDLVKRQLKAGATGVVPIGGTGEYTALSRKERADIVAACVDVADGAPVLPGVLSTGYHDALDAGRDFKDAGAAGLMLVTPYYAVGPQEGMRRYFNDYRAEIDLPILAYEIPRRTNASLSAATYVKLADDGAIIGMKYSNYDMPEFIAVMREAGDRLAVLSGEEPLFATHVGLGAVGGVLASASIYPEFWIKVFELASSGNLKGAMAMQNEIDPVLGAIYRETNPGPLKHFMELAGQGVGGVRLPLTEPSDETKALLTSVLSTFDKAKAA